MILIVVLALVGVFLAYSNLWFWAVHRFVDVRIQLDKKRVEIGDPVSVSCTITNRAWLPLPKVKVTIPLPEGLLVAGIHEAHHLTLRTTIRAREAIVCRGLCTAAARGMQSFVPAEIVFSEGFGLKNMVVEQVIFGEVAVLPPFQDGVFDNIALQSLLGNVEVARWLHPDESMYRGTRPYQDGDPYKHIAWLASATTGQWLVKQFSVSSDATLHLVLNAQGNDDYWTGMNQAVFDQLCAAVATVAQSLGRKGFQLYFWTNAVRVRSGRKLGFGRQSADGIRCLLGELSPLATTSLTDLLNALFVTSNASQEVLLFTTYIADEHKHFIKGQLTRAHVVFSPRNTSTEEIELREITL